MAQPGNVEACFATQSAALQAQAQQIRDTALVELGRELKHEDYHFTAVTPATHARVNRRPGNERAVSLEGVFGWSRPFPASLLPKPMFTLMHEAQVIEVCSEGWRSLVRASTINDSLLFHSAYPTAQADAVFFGPDSYRFVSVLRQYVASTTQAKQRVIDVGCGAGPGAIALACAYPQAQVFATDINQNALRLAGVNARLAGAGNIQVQHSNLLDAVEGRFDLIVANPPYLIDPDRRAYRHGGGVLGAALSLAIVENAMTRLSREGVLVLYTGSAIVDGVDGFLESVRQMLGRPGFHWEYTEMDPDVFGEELDCPAYATTDRIAAVVLCVRKV